MRQLERHTMSADCQEFMGIFNYLYLQTNNYKIHLRTMLSTIQFGKQVFRSRYSTVILIQSCYSTSWTQRLVQPMRKNLQMIARHLGEGVQFFGQPPERTGPFIRNTRFRIGKQTQSSSCFCPTPRIVLERRDMFLLRTYF